MTDARGSLLAALGALGATIGVVHGIGTYRLTQASHLSGRFQEAASLMGEEDPILRLGGIEAMAQLAEQWPDGRQRCVDMLCAHVRIVGHSGDDSDERHDTQRRVMELLVDGVSGQGGWRGCRFDLRKADLDLDLCGVTLTETTIDLSGARIGRFEARDAVLDDVRLCLRGAAFRLPAGIEADDPGVDLTGASLRDGSVVDLSEIDARECEIVFERVDQEAGSRIELAGARITDCRVSFRGLRESAGASLSFRDTTFAEDKLSQIVDFGDWAHEDVASRRSDHRRSAEVRPSRSAALHGRIDFKGVSLGCRVDFRGADLHGLDLVADRNELEGAAFLFDENVASTGLNAV